MNSVDIFDNYTLYEDGSVVSKERVIKTSNRGVYVRRKSDIHPTVSESGYHKVHFRQDGKQKSRYLHKIVAENFLMNPGKYRYVRHVDGDRDNNHVDNLEWTPRYG
jgi:hypothetical protein